MPRNATPRRGIADFDFPVKSPEAKFKRTSG